MALIDDPETEYQVWRDELGIGALLLAGVGILVALFVLIWYWR